MKNRKVILWDDRLGNDQFIDALIKALESKYRFEVVAFSDSTSFKEAFLGNPKSFAFALIDVVEDRSSPSDDEYGFKLGSFCRDKRKDMPIFFLSHDPTAIMKSNLRISQPCFSYYKGIAKDIALEINEFLKYLGRNGEKVFIGHGGRSTVWKDLGNYLRGENLEFQEFNSKAVAGMTVTDRLIEMRENSCFAILILSKEDEMQDGSKRARENVVHEVGFFQSYLGYQKAIILVEEGLDLFSNNQGIIYLKFDPNKVADCFGEIKETLIREYIL